MSNGKWGIENRGGRGATQAAADALIKEELDRSMRKFKARNPTFFGEYTNARMIIDLGSREEDKPATPPASGP